jgi:hypothetical protein
MMFLLIVTFSSMLLAAIMSVIAWRIAAQERRRSDARIAALAEEIHAPASPLLAASSGQRSMPRRAEIGLRAEPPRLTPVPQPRPVQKWDDLPLRAAQSPPADAGLFASTQRPASHRRLAVVAATVAAVAGIAFVAAALRGGDSPAVSASARQTAKSDNQKVAAAQSAPLELVALGHDRDGDRLNVRGVIRNPSAGAALDQLTAVVLVFNRDGGFVTSARAAVDAGLLRSAGEAPFVVTVPDAAVAARYRVSFRSGDRAGSTIVPHVDRRSR